MTRAKPNAFRSVIRSSQWLTVCIALILGSQGCSSPESNNQKHGSPAPSLAATAESPQKLLVIGGTSGVGLQTVELALERGHTVTAIARRPERMILQHPRLRTVAGDILDAASMLRAVAGQDAVVIAIGMGPTREPVSLFSKGGQNVLHAMEQSGLRRLVAVTGIGAGDSRNHGGFFYDRLLLPLALQTIYEDKNRQEALIRQYGEKGTIDWTIVRPGFLTDDSPTLKYRVIDDLNGITAGDITRADVAHFILAALESGLYLNATPLISE